MDNKTKRTTRPYQVPEEYYLKLEAEAKHRRKVTGANINWSGVLREILDKHFGN